ncbi:MAG: site-2 protease family protein [Methanobacteriota archaeon]|nr:MAG: site-2 protease family protein [Euryarchaeota archaeon]
MQTPMPPDAAKEIEYVKSMVARHFPVYDVKVNYDVVEFYCRIDETTLEESFDRLREEMASHDYIPMITYQKGEHVVIVGKRPRSKHRSIYVNLVMLIITLTAMTFAGVMDWASYADVPSSETFSLENIARGVLVFTLPLFAILTVHELGHYFMARKRGVAASLPFFIPSIPPLGTFGAFISLRDPIPSRKSLLEIGVAGPLAGLILAVPIAIAGLMLTNIDAKPIPDDFESGSIFRVAFPLMYSWIEELSPIQGDYLLHPMAFAAWVGFLVTALNLLPAGQLDGGHIARAVLGRNAKFASWITIAALVALSFFYFAWMIFAILILFLGAKHPPPLNDITKLDTKRKVVGVFAFAILVIAFAPVPISVLDSDHSVELSPIGDVNAILSPGSTMEFSFSVENLGNVRNNITVFADSPPQGWVVAFKRNASLDLDYEQSVEHRFDVSENLTYDMRVTCGPSPPGEEQITIIARSLSSQEEEFIEDSAVYSFNVTYPILEFWVKNDTVTVPIGGEANGTVQMNNTGEVDIALTLTVSNLPTIGVDLYEDELQPNHTQALQVSIPANESISFHVFIFTSDSTVEGDRIVPIQVFYFGFNLETIEVGLVVF